MDTCYNCMYRFGSNEQLESAPKVAATAQAVPPPQAQTSAKGAEGCLLGEFLVELEGFLREFLVNRKVDV